MTRQGTDCLGKTDTDENVNGIIAARNDFQNVSLMEARKMEGPGCLLKLMSDLVARDTIPHGLRTG